MLVSYKQAQDLFLGGHTIYITTDQDTIGLGWTNKEYQSLSYVVNTLYQVDTGHEYHVASSNNIDRNV